MQTRISFLNFLLLNSVFLYWGDPASFRDAACDEQLFITFTRFRTSGFDHCLELLRALRLDPKMLIAPFVLRTIAPGSGGGPTTATGPRNYSVISTQLNRHRAFNRCASSVIQSMYRRCPSNAHRLVRLVCSRLAVRRGSLSCLEPIDVR